MTGQELINKCFPVGTGGGISARPEFYSGRGATISDLNSGHLEILYNGILKEFDEEAAKRFAIFVATFPKMAMTPFLNAFFAFINNGCEYEQRPISPAENIEIAKNEDGEYDMTHGLIGLYAHLGGGSERDDTPQIRGEFVMAHADEIGNEKTPRMNIIFGRNEE